MTNKITAALAGNPNSGKTSIFNQLTGARQQRPPLGLVVAPRPDVRTGQVPDVGTLEDQQGTQVAGIECYLFLWKRVLLGCGSYSLHVKKWL